MADPVTAGLRPAENAIATHGLTKDYGALRALSGLDLQVPTGAILGFLGPNGSGKTTTIRVLLDLIRPTAGRATVLGLDCQRDSLAVRQRVGYLPGELRLYDNLTGNDHVRLVSRLRPRPPDPAYLRYLTQSLDIDLARSTGTYSAGNKQKLGLLLAMMGDPEVLLLDEPTGGLDPLVQQTVRRLLEERAAAGRTVFFSSHNLAEVQQLCSIVGILRAGRLVAVEAVDTLRRRAYRVVEATFARPVSADDFHLEGVRAVRLDTQQARFEVDRDAVDRLVKAIARHPVADLSIHEPSLEDLFLRYYEAAEVAP